MKTALSSLGICALLISVSCSEDEQTSEDTFSTDRDSRGGAPNEGEADGLKFEDSSALLKGYERGNADGLAGLAWLDYDNDGDEDLFYPGGVGTPNALFRNEGEAGFTNVAAAAGVDSDTGYSGIAVADIDNDGDLDIYASAEGNDFSLTNNHGGLFVNNGDGTFTDKYKSSGIDAHVTTAAAAFGDVNRDGFVDLFVASAAHRREVAPPAFYESDQLFINNGDGTFSEITESAGVGADLGSCVATFSDYDDDGWLDLFVGVCNNVDDEATPFHLYRNNHDMTFSDVADEAGLNDDLGYWMATAMGDYDNDGDLDLFSTNYGPLGPKGVEEPHALFRNNGDGTYTDMKDPMWTSTFAFGATFGDFDNDGFEDLYVIGDQPYGGYVGPGLGTPGFVYQNDTKGGFEELPDAGGLDLSDRYTSGVARADYDQDGFLDLAVLASAFALQHPSTGAVLASDAGAPVLLRNVGNSHQSVTVRLEGTVSNRAAIGALVRLHVGSLTLTREIQSGSSFISTESLWPTFGIGHSSASKAALEVRWPTGDVEWFEIAIGAGIVDLTEGKGQTDPIDLP